MDKKITKNISIKKLQQERVDSRIERLNALSHGHSKNTDFNLEKAVEQSTDAHNALNAKGTLQKMLVAQMLTIHEYQQKFMGCLINTSSKENRQYLTNTAIKLTNCFTQQAALLARLQGQGGQKIVVERVDVHQGGQAVVGNIQGATPDSKDKN